MSISFETIFLLLSVVESLIDELHKKSCTPYYLLIAKKEATKKNETSGEYTEIASRSKCTVLRYDKIFTREFRK